jgi:hypothetical protein
MAGDIPAIPELGAVQSPRVGVKLDAAALTAPNRAAMQRAQAMNGMVQDVTGVISEHFQKIQDAKNAADLIDAQGKLAATRQTFIEQLQKNPDESKWGEDWQETVKQTQDNIIGKDSKLSPVVRQRLGLEIKEWGNSGAIGVREMANKATNQRSAIKIDGAVQNFAKLADAANPDYQTKDPNYLHAVAAINEGTKAGLWFPEEGEAKKAALNGQVEFYAAKNYIDQHPAGAVDFLNDKTPTGRYRNLTALDPTQRDAMLTEARRKANDAQADYLNNITGAYDANPESAMTRDQLDGLVKAKQISQLGADKYLQLVQKTNLKKSTQDAAQLHMDAHDWDFATSKTPEEDARELKDRAAGLPATLRKPIVELIDNKLNAAKKGAPHAKDYGADYAGQLLKDGKFGPMKVDASGVPTDKPSEEAYTSYYSTLEKLDQYRQQHPKATFEEERAQLAKWTVGSRMKSANSSFSVQDYLSQPDANDTNTGDP